jgi:hypothetical protein
MDKRELEKLMDKYKQEMLEFQRKNNGEITVKTFWPTNNFHIYRIIYKAKRYCGGKTL